VLRESNLIIFQQHANYSVYYITVGNSTCFGCWQPSSGDDTAVKYHTLYLLTYLLHGASPSWEANWFAASQKIPRISRNPKVHYRTHKRPPTVSILGQPNPVHIPTSHLLEIHPNITHPSTPRSPQSSPSLRFPHQDTRHPLYTPIRATCPAHLILLDFITRTILVERYKSFSSSLLNLLHILPRYKFLLVSKKTYLHVLLMIIPIKCDYLHGRDS